MYVYQFVCGANLSTWVLLVDLGPWGRVLDRVGVRGFKGGVVRRLGETGGEMGEEVEVEV